MFQEYAEVSVAGADQTGGRNEVREVPGEGHRDSFRDEQSLELFKEGLKLI